MARSLAQTLTLTRLAPISPSPLSRLIVSRNRSSLPDNFPVDGKREPEESQGELEKVALKNLEDAIHRIVVKRSEPGWLAFAPGASYWVPPKSKAHGFAEVIGKLADNPITDVKRAKKERDLSKANDRCWPASTYYFKGVLNSPLEGEMTPKHTSRSEEEEG